METYFEIAGNQIDGAREYQEDAFMITHLGEGADSSGAALVIVTDGMGGHAAGNVASNLATSTFNKNFAGKYPAEDIPGVLRESLLQANEAIAAAVEETPGLQGMGCTMVSAFVSHNRLWWVSVGDSHLYILRNRELIKKNADHSYGGYLKMMREQGMEVEPDPKLSPNMLMSAMIGDEIAEIDVSTTPVELEPGDRILIATDGLDTLGQGAIIQYSAWSETARDCVEALLKAVEDVDQPRQDNTTAVVIDVKHRASRPAAAPAMELESLEKEPRDFEATARFGPGEEEEDVTEPKTGSAAALVMEAQRDQVPAPEPAPVPPPPPSRAAAAAPPPRERAGSGPWIGLAVLVLVLAGAATGAWYWLTGGFPAPQPTSEAPVPTQPVQPPAPPPTTPPAGTEPAGAQAPEPGPSAPPATTVGPSGGPATAGEGPGPVAPEAQARKAFRDRLKGGGRGPEMVLIPAGTFEMGGPKSTLNRNELPRHTVRVRPFAIGTHEVTMAEYARFARATGRRVPKGFDVDPKDHPVSNVTWDEAYAYARWLTQQTGHRYRLPSEAEWEYAARAGTSKNYWWGWNVGRAHAHCFDCKSELNPRQPARVGYFKANPFGLYDTSGNVSEWVHDCYHSNYRGAPDDSGVWEGGDCTRRVARGGSFSSASSALRDSARQPLVPTQRYDNVGLRVARDP